MLLHWQQFISIYAKRLRSGVRGLENPFATVKNAENEALLHHPVNYISGLNIFCNILLYILQIIMFKSYVVMFTVLHSLSVHFKSKPREKHIYPPNYYK